MGKNFNTWTEDSKFKRPGRTPESKNKLKAQNLLKVCDELNFSPAETAIKIAQGDVPCGVCFGEGVTRYPKRSKETGEIQRLPDGGMEMIMRCCESCYGTMREQVSVKDRLCATSLIMHKLYPELQAVKHEGNIDTDARPSWVIVSAPIVSAGTTSPQIQQKKEDFGD